MFEEGERAKEGCFREGIESIVIHGHVKSNWIVDCVPICEVLIVKVGRRFGRDRKRMLQNSFSQFG